MYLWIIDKCQKGKRVSGRDNYREKLIQIEWTGTFSEEVTTQLQKDIYHPAKQMVAVMENVPEAGKSK